MNLSNIKMNINLSGPGIYCLGLNGASGKTYLFRVLKGLQSISNYEDKVLVFTYDKYVTEDIILNKIDSFKGAIIFLDRFDLYYSDKIIQALYRKNSICLIDLKNNSLLLKIEMKLARVIIEKDYIEVVE